MNLLRIPLAIVHRHSIPRESEFTRELVSLLDCSEDTVLIQANHLPYSTFDSSEVVSSLRRAKGRGVRIGLVVGPEYLVGSTTALRLFPKHSYVSDEPLQQEFVVGDDTYVIYRSVGPSGKLVVMRFARRTGEELARIFCQGVSKSHSPSELEGQDFKNREC